MSNGRGTLDISVNMRLGGNKWPQLDYVIKWPQLDYVIKSLPEFSSAKESDQQVIIERESTLQAFVLEQDWHEMKNEFLPLLTFASRFVLKVLELCEKNYLTEPENVFICTSR